MGSKWAQGANQYTSIMDHTSVKIELFCPILSEHKNARQKVKVEEGEEPLVFIFTDWDRNLAALNGGR